MAAIQFKHKNFGFNQKAKGAIRLHHSNFSFMFNTNYRPFTQTEADDSAEELNQAAAMTFTLDNLQDPELGWVRFVYNAGTKKKPVWVDDKSGSVKDLRRISVKHEAELGNNAREGMRMHIHGIVKIMHVKYIRIDYKKIQEEFKQNMIRLGSQHNAVNFRWKVEKISMKQYLQKWENPKGEGLTVEGLSDNQEHLIGETNFTVSQMAESLAGPSHGSRGSDAPGNFTVDEFVTKQSAMAAAIKAMPADILRPLQAILKN